MTDKRENVAVIIVTFNASQWIERCIESLLNQNGSALHIIVVDNCSADDTLEQLSRYGEKITVINSPRNVGFGQANNIGFVNAISMGCEYCFLLNQDAWIEPDCISILIDAARNDKNAGILSPVHCSYSSNNLHSDFLQYLPLRLQKSLPTLPFNIDFVPAALWMISVKVLLETGGFDPVFFMYGEDNDLMTRVHNRGRSLVVVPGAIGHHQEVNEARSTNRLAARYFFEIATSLRFSDNPMWHRYTIIGMKAFWKLVKSVCACKLQRCLATFLSLWWVVSRFSQIEASKKILASSRSPFIDEA